MHETKHQTDKMHTNISLLLFVWSFLGVEFYAKIIFIKFLWNAALATSPETSLGCSLCWSPTPAIPVTGWCKTVHLVVNHQVNSSFTGMEYVQSNHDQLVMPCDISCEMFLIPCVTGIWYGFRFDKLVMPLHSVYYVLLVDCMSW